MWRRWHDSDLMALLGDGANGLSTGSNAMVSARSTRGIVPSCLALAVGHTRRPTSASDGTKRATCEHSPVCWLGTLDTEVVQRIPH